VEFIDREQELAFLEGKWREGGAQLIVLWGKRGVGKTELIRTKEESAKSQLGQQEEKGVFLPLQQEGPYRCHGQASQRRRSEIVQGESGHLKICSTNPEGISPERKR